MSETKQVEEDIKEEMARLEGELQKVRSGRASASTVEDIMVDYFGSKQPIKALGSIGTLDAQTLVVEPWDQNALEAIAGAITKAQNGLNAVVDGNRVRIPFPSLSQERRAEFIKLAANRAEESKVKLRQLRDEAIKDLKKQKEAKTISEDGFFTGKEKLEELFKKYFSTIEELKERKEKELSSI